MEKGLLETISLTTSTCLFGGEGKKFFDIDIRLAFGFEVTPFDIRDDSFIAHHALRVSIMSEGHLKMHEIFFITTIENRLAIMLAEVFVGHIRRDFFITTHREQHRVVVSILRPRQERSFVDGEIRIDEIFFEKCRLLPEPKTVRTCPIMGIEGKIRDGQFRQRKPATHARILEIVEFFFA